MRITGVFGALLVTAALAGCGSTDGRPTAAPAAESSTSAQTTSTVETTTARPSPTPEGSPIGTATMQVRGGTAPVTITYQINGEPEQTETNVALPWEKQYPVYDKVQSSVRADGGDTELICTIIMDDNLVSFVTEPRPTCSFAYY
ncbi:hypothetical protein [Arthrobacter sp. SLBN-53]|uniref:hypothetical protein n=1 Tax=Arthrobacter sp. SLBN-53 TaxID=2768412 RepID=UPI001151AE21|nr:hypothetical protein [Arthrobacter sp. SLBN-53]